MSAWLRGLLQRARVVLGFARVDAELDRELRDHFNRETERFVRAGAAPEEARRRAAARFGNLEALKEEARDERGGRLFLDAASDVRIGWRLLGRNPGFTAAVIVSLALGTGGTTAIFSVVDAVLMRPLPYPASDELQTVEIAWGDFTAPLSPADYLQLRDQRAVADVGAFWTPTDGFTLRSETLSRIWITRTRDTWRASHSRRWIDKWRSQSHASARP